MLNHSPPQLGGNIGPMVLVRGDSRFEANCNVYRNFIQIGLLVRKIFTDNLFRRHRQRHTHKHTRQAKSQFSGRVSVSRVREMC